MLRSLGNKNKKYWAMEASGEQSGDVARQFPMQRRALDKPCRMCQCQGSKHAICILIIAQAGVTSQHVPERALSRRCKGRFAWHWCCFYHSADTGTHRQVFLNVTLALVYCSYSHQTFPGERYYSLLSLLPSMIPVSYSCWHIWFDKKKKSSLLSLSPTPK